MPCHVGLCTKLTVQARYSVSGVALTAPLFSSYIARTMVPLRLAPLDIQQTLFLPFFVFVLVPCILLQHMLNTQVHQQQPVRLIANRYI